ncbi:3'-5' exonuclease [Hydrogenophaga sp.]|uniref:3'-5' exonuclease n=1 Tax=Hydrogenophaga sp. TaxID=1904254 RepID=UPI003565F820
MLHPGLLRGPGWGAQTATPDWRQRFEALAQSARDPRLKAYYAAGAVSGDTPMAQVPLMALDVETTGLDPVKDGIVSIGLVPMDLDRIRASASRHWLLKPRVPLGEVSVTIHGITDSQVSQAPDLATVLAEVLQCMAGHVLVVHCRDIEYQFLNGALRPRIGEGIEFPVIDTMELEARLHRGQRIGWRERLLGRRAPPLSIRLADSRKRYGLPRYRPHHALTDALASAELLQAQIAHRFTPDTPLKALWR